jgi:hypothetical protein
MTRKLHRAMLALSTTAAVFTLLLLAGNPISSPKPLLVEPLAIAAAPYVVVADSVSDDLVARRHQRHSRALLALPYFSFAQVLRRNRS